MSFAENLKFILTRKNITVTELSKRTEIPASTLYSIIQRGSSPSIDVLKKICVATNCRLTDFFVDDPDFEANYLLYDGALYPEEQLLLADYRILTPDLQIVVSEFVQHYRFHERSWDHPNLGVDDFYEIYRFIEYLCYKNCLNEKYYIDCRPVAEDGHPITEKEWNDYYFDRYVPPEYKRLDELAKQNRKETANDREK